MTPVTSLGRSAAGRTRWSLYVPLLAMVLATLTWSLVAPPPATASAPSHTTHLTPAATAPGDPDLGPNVYVFDPSMPVSQIKATADAIA